MEKLRVFLADARPVARHGLALAIGDMEDMEVVGEASAAREALDAVARLRPDMKLKRLAILLALMLIVAFSASTGSSLFAPRVVDGGAFGSGLEILRPVEEFAKTADVVVRGVPIS